MSRRCHHSICEGLVMTPFPVQAEWIEANYLELLQHACEAVLDRVPQLAFHLARAPKGHPPPPRAAPEGPPPSAGEPPRLERREE